MLDDLKLNLLSEAIGIFFTVLILDRLFRWREQKRWEPVKHATYTMITEVTVDMYRHLLPLDNRTEPSFVYVFGTHHVYSFISLNYKRENLYENVLEKFQEDPDYFYEKLDYYEDKYEDLIESRLFVLGEDLVETLLEVPNLLERTKSRINRPVPDSIDDDMKDLTLEQTIRAIETAILMATVILGIMKGKATDILTLEEADERLRPEKVFSDYNTAYMQWYRARWISLSVWPRFLKQVIKKRYRNVRYRLAIVTDRIRSLRE